MAIKMHSRTGNILQLRHDLRNGPAHVFGNHSKCNPDFCKHATSSSTCSPLPPPAAADSDLADEHGLSSTDDDPDHNNFSDMIDTIIAAEESDEPTTSEKADAQTGQSSMLESLPEGLFAKVLACGDRLVMLAPQLISNETSNLAECYMSIRSCFDGGKQYNRIQKGSFEHRCYAAGLRIQNGCQWPVDFWKNNIRRGIRKGNYIMNKISIYYMCMQLLNTCS